MGEEDEEEAREEEGCEEAEGEEGEEGQEAEEEEEKEEEEGQEEEEKEEEEERRRQAQEGPVEEQGAHCGWQDRREGPEGEGRWPLQAPDAERVARGHHRQEQDDRWADGEIGLGVHQGQEAEQGPHHHPGREAQGGPAR